MVDDLQLQVAEALRAGSGLVEIEDSIIDPSPVDEEEKAVLWLYAEAMRERRGVGLEREPALLGS